MANARELKSDWLRGGKSSFPIPLGASVVIGTATGGLQTGKFVTAASTGAIHSVAGSTMLTGWVEVGPWDYTNGAAHPHFLSNGTALATVVNCIRDLTAVFRMPLLYTALLANWSAAETGLYSDLVASTAGLQMADLTTATRNVLIGVGGLAATAVNTSATLGDGYVDVMMNPATSIGV